MIRAILAFVAWLDRKFPPKVVVRQEDYDALTNRLHAHEKKLAGLDERIKDEQEWERIHEAHIVVLTKTQNEHADAVRDYQVRIDALEKSLTAIKEVIANGGVPITSLSPTARAALKESFLRGDFPRIDKETAAAMKAAQHGAVV